MYRRVPLARRAVFQDRRRAALSTGGVAAALLLVLLLDGIVAGAMRQVTAYLRGSPADVIVAQEGVRTMHMSVSSLPPGTVDAVGRTEGVAWAEGLHYTSSPVVSTQGREASYIFGYDPGGRLGPRRLTSGSPPRMGEALVDEVAAGRLGVGVGDRVSVFGESFVVSGLFRDGTSMVNTITFITAAEFTRLRSPSVAYVFAGAEAGVDLDELVERLQGAVPGVTVQTRAQFVRQEADIVRDMAADLLQIMSIVGLSIALAVIGLTLFTLTLSKLREHAVLKALGSRSSRLAGVVLTQAAWSIGVGLAVATAVGLLIAALIGRSSAGMLVTIEPASVLRAGVGALAVGMLGSLVPLWRVVGVDPATAFRRAS